ncbi:MAG: helix-turn-helix domain-containing protein [Bacteroidota bacterium]|nr:helix-turn-helix domain-containing protein [Bacteroidota bacterium]
MKKCYTPNSPEYKKIIGKNIQLARERKGWNQMALGNALEISKGAVSLIENGITDLSVSCLQFIAELLDTDVCNLTSSHTIHSKKEFLNMLPQQNVLMDMAMVTNLYTEVADLKIQIKKLLPPPKKKVD